MKVLIKIFHWMSLPVTHLYWVFFTEHFQLGKINFPITFHPAGERLKTLKRGLLIIQIQDKHFS
jgi:hypothetical protein